MGKYAIVGLSCLFPGAATPDAYWNNLMGAVDSRTEGGERIFGHDPLAEETGPEDERDRHRIYCTRGGFIEATADLDPSGYLLPADYLAGLDRSFHWALRVAGDALADAGVSPAAADGRAAGRRTGVVFGNYPFPTPASGRTAGKLWDAAVYEGLAAAGFPAAGLPSGAADGSPARDRAAGPAQRPLDTLPEAHPLGRLDARAEADNRGSFGAGAVGGRGGSVVQGPLGARLEARRLGSFEARAEADNRGSFGAGAVGGGGGSVVQGPLGARLEARRLGSFEARAEADNRGSFGAGAVGGRGGSVGQGPLGARLEARRLGSFEARAEAHNLWPGGLPAHVVAAALGLDGPRHTLDAACSSALYAIKLACAQLATGRADLMLAGGVCAPDPTVIHLSFSDLHAYPPDGFSQPFDARSKGIITGQGAAMVALKRLADARRDGDRVYAVVDAVALGNDGPGKHLLAPNVNGQLAAYELAQKDAGIEPQDVQYVECHATGTPLGDRTELDGVERHFGRGPLLGSVKGNIGHLLTAAGMSSLVKVVLALGHGVIPPTVGVERPLPDTVANRVVREPTPWPATEGVRRAAVSAFGFGGTNAHVVLSGPETDAEDDGTERRTPQSLAVIGMGAHFGSLTTLDEFERAGYEGTGAVRELPSHRWRGFETLGDGGAPQAAYIDGFEVDATSYRIPPKDLDHFNQQHLLMMRVAEEALKDAGYERPAPGGKDGAKGRRVAVVLGMEMEPSAEGHGARYALGRKLAAWSATAGLEPTEQQLAALTRAARDGIHDSIEANEVLSYIGNIMAARISSLWNLTGPSFTVSSDSAVGVDALDTARLLLLDPSIEAVLVGAVDLAAGPESTRARELLTPGSVLGDGAGAVVVTRPGSVPPGRTVYATVDALAVHHSPTLDPRPAPDLVAAAAEEALAAAGVTPADVELVEAGAAQDGTLEGLTRVWSAERAGGLLRTAVSSVNSAVGDTGCASALASVIRAALCLHYGYQPIAPEGVDGARLAGSAFFLAGDSRPWLRERREGRRTASVSVIGSAGSHAHVVLGGAQTRGEVAATDWVRSGGSLVVPVGADDIDTLMRRLGELREAVDSGADWTAQLADDRPAALKAVLVADDPAGLVRQLDQAAKDLPAVYRAGGEWTSPSGSCFAARPAGGPGTRTALVYPGAFNSYLGLGRSLFRAFPGLLPRFETQAELPAEMLRSAALYPRALGPLGRRELMGREAELIEDIPLMLAVGTSYALLSTDLVREVLGVPVHGAFGYSLGESSMLFATGGWIKEARATTKIDASPLFVDRLRGPKKTVRALWGLGDEVPDQQVWATHVLLAPTDAVRAAVQRHDRVFITHVNTPTEVVVAGDPAQCRDVIAELGCQSARSPANHVMHCPVVDGVLSELADLNRYPTGDVGDLVLYSSRHYAPVGALDQDVVAHNIAVTLRETVDFPRLIRRAYEDGFRCFIEVGPSSTCTRWIHETLGDDPHLSVPVDRRGARGATDIARLVARLATHGVPVDLTPFRPRTAAPRRAPGLRTFTVGGTPVAPLVRDAAAPVLQAVRRAPHRPAPPPTPAAAVMGGAERGEHGAVLSPSRAPAAAATNVPGGEADPRDGAAPGGGAERRNHPTPTATASARGAAPQGRAVTVRADGGPVPAPAAPESATAPPAPTPAGATAPVATASGGGAEPPGRAVPSVPLPAPAPPVPATAPPAPTPAGPTVPVATASGGGAEPPGHVVPVVALPASALPVPATAPPAPTPAGPTVPVATASGGGAEPPGRVVPVVALPASALPAPATVPTTPTPAGATVPVATASGGGAEPPGRVVPVVALPAPAFPVPATAPPTPTPAGATVPVATASDGGAEPPGHVVPVVALSAPVLPVPATVPTPPTPAGPTVPVVTASGGGAEPPGRAVPSVPVAVGDVLVPVPAPATAPPAPMPAAAPVPAVTAVAAPGAAAPVPVTAGAPDQAPELPVTAFHATEWDTAMPTRPDGPPVPALSLEREPITMLPADAVSAQSLGAVPPQAERADVPPRPAIFGAPLPVPEKPRQPDDHAATLTLVRSLRAEILEAHQEVLDAQRELREELTAVLSASTPVRPTPAATEHPPKPEGVVWDEHDLLEFAVGKVGNVFGPRFTRIDGYDRRVRLPAPPYLFATRVTRLDAEPGEFKPSFIRTEYDVPEDAWYAVDGQVPPAVTIEAGQCDLLLISYLGADFTNRGQRVYRLLDSSLSFLGDLPRTGQTLRYDIWIDQFVRQGDTLLFFFHYDCYADGELILKLNNACAGFFTDEELESSPGLVQGRVAPGLKEAADPGRTAFKPLATTHRTSLTSADLDALAEGRVAEVFGPGHRQPPGCNTSLRLPTRPLLMADEVTVLDRKGGSHGLGRIEAVKELAPDAWYFTSHFPDDPVLAGSLVAEGAVQLLETYALSLGLHLTLPDARFQPVPDLRTEVKVRGQITPRNARIEYRIDITELTLLPRPSLVADVVVLRDGTPSISVTGLGIRLREKPGTPYRPETAGTVPHFLGRLSPATGEPALLNEFHMAHAAKGDLAVAMGPEFEIYADSRAPYIPNGDFLFVDRVMKLEGTRGTLKRGAVMVTEYDSPEDAWYYADNGHPSMPNCVHMESSLQAAILLGYYLGATLPFPEEQFSIRNLDGHATLVKDIDLRGKTVQHRSTLLSSDRMPGSILQNFSYELSCDGEVFYTGESLFGYFNEKALAHQVGLDKGQHVLPWLDTQPARPPGTRRVDLRDFRAAESARRGPRLAGGHLDLVEWVDILPGGGEHGQGYLRGHRSIRPDEWYFSCHFHRDPVMPGSLGVEALLQGMQVYAVETGLTDGLRNPRFALSAGTDTTWSYRGQILRTDPDMEFDVHIKEIRREPGRIVLLGDAHVWKSTLRIYRLGDLGIEIHHD
ncbi:beta-ketoacyl synthase N-terminal-like domain-containing protein [Streptomyces longisporus]|uniref:Ketosynthase family 3 (KS3) domain-containing protein n=1 Tax=Streptomyces longisporus TaxID=1948 RepID=A0ABN3MUJ4_STRLO